MGLKRFCLIAGFVGMAAFLMASASWAQVKIGYLDPDEILSKYKPFQDAQKEVQRFRMELEREFTKLQGELEKMKETYERQALLLSEKRKQEEQQAILKKQGDLERYLSDISDPSRGQLTKKNQEVLSPILNKVNEVVQVVAKDNGYDFVFNTAALAYADEAHDLTEKVLEALQKELEAAEKEKGGPGPSGAGPRRR